MSNFSEQELVRREKLKKIIDLGINPYPAETFPVSHLAVEIKENLNFPLSDNIEILKIAKVISEELSIDQQIFLINLAQQKFWAKTKNKNIVKKLENLKGHLKSFIQPRLAWEVNLLKIAIEDL